MRLIDADALGYSIAGNIPLMPTVRIAIEHRIDDAPTVEAEPVKHGRWVDKPIEDELELPSVVCSECGQAWLWSSNYCPNCGARMDKEE